MIESKTCPMILKHVKDLFILDITGGRSPRRTRLPP